MELQDYEERIIYTSLKNLEFARSSKTILPQATLNAVQLLQFCRLKLYEKSLEHEKTNIYELQNFLEDNDIPPRTAKKIVLALTKIEGAFDLISATTFEELEINIIKNQILIQKREQI